MSVRARNRNRNAHFTADALDYDYEYRCAEHEYEPDTADAGSCAVVVDCVGKFDLASVKRIIVENKFLLDIQINIVDT